MSLSKPISGYRKVDESETIRSPKGSRSVPIACRVCDRVFYDNVSLVLHFECHIEDEIALNLSQFSSSLEKRRNASFDARANLSPPTPHPNISHYGSTSASSSSEPLMYPQLGARSFANGSAHLPPLQIREITGAELRLSRSMNPQTRQPVQPVPEVIIPEVIVPEVIVPEIINPDIIIISDDEEDNNEDEEDNKEVAAEIDLELKL